MIEATYEDSKIDSKDKKLIDTLINTNSDDMFESTYLIYFDLDNQRIQIESKKYIANHNQQYLYITEGGNLPQYAPTVRELTKITQIPAKKNKNQKIKKVKRSVISGVQYIMEKANTYPKKLIKILETIENTFYSDEAVFTEGKKKGHFKLKDKHDKVFENIPNKGSIYSLGYIQNGSKQLLCNMPEYVNLLEEYKFPSLTVKNSKVGICDFCGEEKPLIDDFGKGDYRLNTLKMFGSTYKKGFFNLDNKKDLWKTIRCCEGCIKILQKMDNRVDDEYRIATLTSSSGSGRNRKQITIYLLVRDSLGRSSSRQGYAELNNMMKSSFGSSSIHSTLENIAELKNRMLAMPQDIVIDLYFNIKSQQKNQVLYEVKNVYLPDIQNMLGILFHLEKIKRLFYPKSYFNLNRIFQILSLYNYKVSVDTIKDFFFQKTPAIDSIMGAMNKHLRSSVFNSYPDNKAYIYNQLSMDVSLFITFAKYLNKEYKMEKITKSLILEEYTDDEQIKYYPKDIRQFVDNVYQGLEDWEISMMELGELIKNIANKLAQNGKKGREKVFLEKINFNGMDNKKLQEYLVFVNKKIIQYANDLKNAKPDYAEKLNQITIDIQNHELDPKISILRIIDGFNLRTRAWRMANEISNQNNKGE